MCSLNIKLSLLLRQRDIHLKIVFTFFRLFSTCFFSVAHETRLHPLTCLRRFCLVSLGSLVQGNKATLRGILEVFSSKVELQLCILSARQGEGQFAWCKSGTCWIVFNFYINEIP